MWARHSTASHMEKFARLYRRFGENAAALVWHRERAFTHWEEDNGMVSIRTRLPAEQAAVVLKAIEAAKATLDGGDLEDVSAETRIGPVVDPDAPGLAEAALVPVLHDGEEILLVGRKTRAVPPAIRRALRLRDRGCRFPGCTHTRFVDAHHIRHWADGGETKLSNLVELCGRHHRLLHEGGFSCSIRPQLVEQLHPLRPQLGRVRGRFLRFFLVQQGSQLLVQIQICHRFVPRRPRQAVSVFFQREQGVKAQVSSVHGIVPFV
jgi:hypothetical protein